jgi:hypothetical protein
MLVSTYPHIRRWWETQNWVCVISVALAEPKLHRLVANVLCKNESRCSTPRNGGCTITKKPNLRYPNVRQTASWPNHAPHLQEIIHATLISIIAHIGNIDHADLAPKCYASGMIRGVGASCHFHPFCWLRAALKDCPLTNEVTTVHAEN